jgi:hypothetical protein
MSIINSNKWCDFGCHQNSFTLDANAHTHVVFHTVNEIVYLFFTSIQTLMMSSNFVINLCQDHDRMDRLASIVGIMWTISKPKHSHHMSMCIRRCYIFLTTTSRCYAQSQQDCKSTCLPSQCHWTFANANKITPKVSSNPCNSIKLWAQCGLHVWMHWVMDL